MEDRDIWNLQSTVADQERQITDLQYRVNTLETALARVNRTIDETLEAKFKSVWRAINGLQEYHN